MKKLLIKLQNKIIADGKKCGLATEYSNNMTGEVIRVRNRFLANVYFRADGIFYQYAFNKFDIEKGDTYLAVEE